MAKVDYKELKKGGFMKQVQKDTFSLRLRGVGGQVTAEQLKKITEVAEAYGQGYIHLTSRQGIEIPFIKLEDIEAVKAELAKAGVQPGACGARVRTITACQGRGVCPDGLIDTTALAKEFDEKFFGKDLPHKFKLGITGCRNNCLKAEENDLGIKGGLKPEWHETKCNSCGLCEAICPTKAITTQKDKQGIAFDEAACIYCGRCVKSCPAEAWTGESGFIVYFGGLFGNRIAIGDQLVPIIFSKEQLHTVVATVVEFFKQHGKQGERLRTTLDRVGRDNLERVLKSTQP